MMKTRSTLALLLLPALAAAAASALAGTGATVGQKDKQFSQESVTVKHGGAVRFVNDDAVTHNLSVRDPAGTNRPGVVQKPGDATEITFDASGRYAVTCLIHPKMKMTVQAE